MKAPFYALLAVAAVMPVQALLCDCGQMEDRVTTRIRLVTDAAWNGPWREQQGRETLMYAGARRRPNNGTEELGKVT
ncbi:hypothetical protein CH063_15183 [Colletotrichum higginsianum]|uniref:Uncharacterized protein n=1 Tax=Colletotrichum higginsianum (strain IMI 349063) TaxID=759273 RepID=H1W1S2_COLHI|nr:hypothetical protein CH063_15183 [Colletotrichum higginsianum]